MSGWQSNWQQAQKSGQSQQGGWNQAQKAPKITPVVNAQANQNSFAAKAQQAPKVAQASAPQAQGADNPKFSPAQVMEMLQKAKEAKQAGQSPDKVAAALKAAVALKSQQGQQKQGWQEETEEQEKKSWQQAPKEQEQKSWQQAPKVQASQVQANQPAQQKQSQWDQGQKQSQWDQSQKQSQWDQNQKQSQWDQNQKQSQWDQNQKQSQWDQETSNSSSSSNAGIEPGMLPLRLEAEPIVRKALGPASRVIGSDGKPALIFSEAGLVAVALEKMASWGEVATAVGVPENQLPGMMLVRGVNNSPGLSWVFRGQPCPPSTRPDQIKEMAMQGVVSLTESIAEAAVRTIQRYYAVQVLEPSTRGFLSILEKQFARSDLYLFEVLQNAVDDGALYTCFESTPKGLVVRHNGRRFSALDVLGLSSVGLSTKGDGQKRTIGFMGIGFKAVYKRFARVLIHDHLWRFSFEEPQGHQPGAGGNFGWVLQPRWENKTALWDTSPVTGGWCHFQLERPREGPAGVMRDLAKLPESVPPLLGRQSLRNAARRSAERVTCNNVREADAIQYWSLEAQKTCGILTAEIAQAPLQRMLGILRQSFQQTKEAIWKAEKDQFATQTEQFVSTQDKLPEYGWRYIDNSKNIQGPFSAPQVRQWYSQGKLSATLRISGPGMGDYSRLDEVFPIKEQAFAAPGLPPPRFRLDWGKSEHSIGFLERIALKDGTSEEIGVFISTRAANSTDRVEPELNRWLFLTVQHKPDAAAKAAYEKHAKREFVGDEEVSLFFQLDEDGDPIPMDEAKDGSGRGAVHAVLPTELRTPVGANLQASWLLSVDRQRLQDFADNAWNLALLQTLPKLLATLLRWIAHTGKVAEAYGILPDMDITSHGSNQGQLKSLILNQEISWDLLRSSVKAEALVPALKSDGSVQFVKAFEAIWVPPSFVQFLPPDFLISWLGMAPLAASKIGDAVWHPLWFNLRQVDVKLLSLRRKNLADAVKNHKQPAAIAVKLLAALAVWAETGDEAERAAANQDRLEALQKQAEQKAAAAAKLNKNKQNESQAQATATPVMIKLQQTVKEAAKKSRWIDAVPDFDMWPVFYTAKGECVNVKQVRWPDPLWSKLPAGVRDILQDSVGGESGTQSLSMDLAPLIGAGALPKIEGTETKEVLSARKCMELAKKNVPMAAVSIQDAVQKKMQQWQNEGKIRGLSQDSIKQIVAISRWAMENNDSNTITHALTGDDKALRLVPISDLHLRTDEIVCLEQLSSVKLPYVNAAYSAEKEQEAPRWDSFWRRCGAKVGISFQASAVEANAQDRMWLANSKLPQLRNSQKEVALPYDLGQITNKNHKAVDVQFSAEWAQVVEKISSSTPEGDDWAERAASLAQLVARTVPDGAGGGEPAANSVAAKDKNMIKPPPAPPRHNAKSLQQGTMPPAYRRLYWLPPQQPKEQTCPLGLAAWLRQLRDAKWVPGKIESSDKDTPTKRAWYQTCEVLLEPDPKKPGFPIAEVPPEVRRAFKGKAYVNIFEWGTIAPEPPVDRLLAVAQGKATEPVEPLWRTIAQARQIGALKPALEAKLKGLANAKALPVPPGGLLDGATLVNPERCVSISADLSQDEREEAQALVAAKWLVDLRSLDWPLHDVMEEVCKLINVNTKVTSKQTTAFVKWCCDEKPENPNDAVRDAFTYSMKRVLEDSKKLPMKRELAIKRLIPNFSVFCREGPGLGKDRFPARWLPMAGGSDKVKPILNDSQSKAAMLTPSQGFQLMGVFDHPESRFPSGAKLEIIDRELIKELGILRLSDPKIQMRTRVTGEKKHSDRDSARLGVILRLLWRAAGVEASEDDETTTIPDIQIYRCSAIYRELVMTGDTKSQMEAFAIWGDDDKEGRSTVILASDPDDYAAELEELLETRFAKIFDACKTRPTKALNLLRHIENEKRFNKYVDRDFAGVLEHEEAQRRKIEEKRLAEERAEQEAAERREREEREAEERIKKQKEDEERRQQQMLEEKERLERERQEEEEREAEEEREEAERLEKEQRDEEKKLERERQAEEERMRKEFEEESKRLEAESLEELAKLDPEQLAREKGEAMKAKLEELKRRKEEEEEERKRKEEEEEEFRKEREEAEKWKKELMEKMKQKMQEKAEREAKEAEEREAKEKEEAEAREREQKEKEEAEAAEREAREKEEAEEREREEAEAAEREAREKEEAEAAEREAKEKAEAGAAEEDAEAPEEEAEAAEKEAEAAEAEADEPEADEKEAANEDQEEKDEEDEEEAERKEREAAERREKEEEDEERERAEREEAERNELEEAKDDDDEPDAKRRKLDEAAPEEDGELKEPEKKKMRTEEPAEEDDEEPPDIPGPPPGQPPPLTEALAEGMNSLEMELKKLREENAKLRLTQPEFLYGRGVPEEGQEMPNNAAPSSPIFPQNEESEKSDSDSDKDEDDVPVTKAQIRKMKQEAKEVLERPMTGGFGFKMMTEMGWKPGMGLGKQKDGISTPIWLEPREGKCGLFSIESGEARPKKDERPEEERYAETKQFITEGGVNKKRPRVPKEKLPPPTVKTVVPGVLDWLLRPGGVGELGGMSTVTDLLAEALAGEAGERFVKLVDERLGPKVAPKIAQMRKTRLTNSMNHRDQMMQPLWQLTKHHVPEGKEEDEEDDGKEEPEEEQ